MSKIPRIPSKGEAYARVRSQGEENKLDAVKNELDKVCKAESNYLQTHRNRFVLDRRRSMGNVYNSQIEGIQPHMRIRRRRRDSDPEVLDIFRRQEDRRRSLKVMEDAMGGEVMRGLEKRYQEALARDGNDADAEESESDSEVIYVPGRSLPETGPGHGVKGGSRRRGKEGGTTRDLHLPHHHHDKGGRRSLDCDHLPKISSSGTEGKRHGKRDDQPGDRGSSSSEERADPEPEVAEGEPQKEDDSTPEMRQRKRSYSEGNISTSILELQNINIQVHPYLLAKTAAAATAALVTSHVEDPEEETHRPYPHGAFVEFPASPRGVASPGDINRNETFVIESDVTNCPSLIRRRVNDVISDRNVPDLTAAWTRPKAGDVTSRSVQSDVTSTVRRTRRSGVYNTSPQLREISLSPSLKRRLAGLPASPRKDTDNVTSSLPHHADVSSQVSPRGTRHHHHHHHQPAVTDSPTLSRRKKDDRPKPIYQQTTEAADKPAPRRPLRRSRSEAVDLMTARDKDRTDVPRTERRGSDSVQVLAAGTWGRSRPPRSWNSLLYGLTLNAQEKEDIARHKREELLTSLRKRQEAVDSDVSRRIQAFLQRYEEA